MFSADKPLPRPPLLAKPTNISSSNRNQNMVKSDQSGAAFDTARAIFNAVKRPEVQKAMSTVAKNAQLRSAAISAAKNPQTRDAFIRCAKNEEVRKAALNIAAGNSDKPKQFSNHSTNSPPHDNLQTSKNFSSFESLQSQFSAMNIAKSGPASGVPVLPKVNQSSVPFSYLSSSISSPLYVENSSVSEPHGMMKYAFKSTHFDELNCQPNDIVILKKEVDAEWIYGKNLRTGKNGIVPVSFLEVKIPLVSSNQWVNCFSEQGSILFSVRALYDFNSGVDGDLQFSANEIINVTKVVNNDWYSGEIGTRRGIFPANFAEKIDLNNYEAVSGCSESKSIETVKAAFDYNSGIEEDLVFRQDDIIEVIEWISQDWLKGRLNGKIGLVPRTYLVSSEDSGKIVTAIEDYHHPSGEHLSFSKGDKIEIISEVDAEWLKGKLLLNMSNKKFFPVGIFPRNVVS